MPNAVGSLKSEVESCFMFEPLVLFALDRKGWCSALSAGGAPEARGFWTYNIECSDLTEEGEGLRAHTTSSLSTRVLPITTHIITYMHTLVHTCSGHHLCQPHALSPLRLICTVHYTLTFPHAHAHVHTYIPAYPLDTHMRTSLGTPQCNCAATCTEPYKTSP